MFYLRNCIDVDNDEIMDYFHDFSENGYCYVLRQLYDIDIVEWKKLLHEIDNTLFFCMFDDNKNLVGVGRITKKPRRYTSGNIGYGIRPQYRGNGYGVNILNLLSAECYNNNIELRACVENTNIASMKTMERAGFHKNNVTHDWGNGRVAYEYVK